jgi:D-tyrosyl-tRNA(Tyr) deacylase
VRLVVQRVSRAEVRAQGRVVGAIGRGAAVLVGIGVRDTPELADRLADRLLGLRYFEDAGGRTNLAIDDVDGAFLVVSQFTLLADLRRGRRPGFALAAPPELAEPMVDRFIERLRKGGRTVATGRFGAAMELELVNDGPFTLVVEGVPRAESDLLGGPDAARAGLDAHGRAVALHHHRLQVGQPAAQRALAVHADRLGVPAGEGPLAADVAGSSHRGVSMQ